MHGLWRRVGSLVLAGLCATLAACGAHSHPEPLVLASTTSTEDSGLFDVLIPAFQASNPAYQVRVVAVGTGQALELGRRKDADVLLVHAPPAESAFVANRYGIERRRVMYNDFVIVGPASDPAGVAGMTDAAAALAAIAEARAPFVSRGDDSGTHRKERSLWDDAGVTPSGDWYREAGQGMGAVLRMVGEMGAYTLTDRGTYLNFAEELGLTVLVEGDPRLRNQYGVITVAGAMNPEGARAFADWVTGPEGQRVIGEYGVARFGKPLFQPNAGS